MEHYRACGGTQRCSPSASVPGKGVRDMKPETMAGDGRKATVRSFLRQAESMALVVVMQAL